MKDAIELFARLGDFLRGFGDDSQRVGIIERACAANEWFSAQLVHRAIGAIADDMLQRDKLRAWLEHYPVPVATPRRVLVVMAGNIPLVGFFDLLCVVASGHVCLVKPSAKDRVLMEYVVAWLRDNGATVSMYEDEEPVDAVIATGSDNANRYFRAHYAGIPSLLRGNRQSVAVLSGNETSEQLRGLADDIWAYSGLGCRNVSLVFIPDGYKLCLEMPSVTDKYLNNYRQRRALLTMTGRPFLDLGGAVAVDGWDFSSALSEITIARYRSLAQVEAWLSEHDADLQCVVTECLPHSRRVTFGCAQSPALTDYPDDRDVIAFLSALN